MKKILQRPVCWIEHKLQCRLQLVFCSLVLSLLCPLDSNAVTLESTSVHAMAGPAYNLHAYHSYLTGFEGGGFFGSTFSYERRSYFTFDLSGVTDTITSASFVIWSPPPLTENNNTGGFRSDRSKETFELHEVLTPAATIEAIPFGQDDTPGVEAVWEDLGDGPVFGAVVMTEADEPGVTAENPKGGKDIVITLNATALQSMNNATGKWTLGGIVNPLPSRLADFDEDVDVDGVDLATWKSGYSVDDSGDTNEDSDTDGSDFLTWQREYTPAFEVGNWQLFGGAVPYYTGNPLFKAPLPQLELVTSPASLVAIPEPSSVLLFFVAIVILPTTFRNHH